MIFGDSTTLCATPMYFWRTRSADQSICRIFDWLVNLPLAAAAQPSHIFEFSREYKIQKKCSSFQNTNFEKLHPYSSSLSKFQQFAWELCLWSPCTVRSANKCFENTEAPASLAARAICYLFLINTWTKSFYKRLYNNCLGQGATTAITKSRYESKIKRLGQTTLKMKVCKPLWDSLLVTELNTPPLWWKTKEKWKIIRHRRYGTTIFGLNSVSLGQVSEATCRAGALSIYTQFEHTAKRQLLFSY